MDEIWERAVETALEGQTDVASVRTLTLDGVVKCVHGRLPPPSLFEKYHNLQHFSIANIGVSSLEQFPRLQNLQKLILSDNRIAGGLEFLVQAGLESLRDLDLSNNRIHDINDLRPLAQIHLLSLDLYECPVTRVKDYRSQVFGLIRSLKYLDKMDAEGNERPESDEEEDEGEDEEDDPGSGEIDGVERPYMMSNGHKAGSEGVVDVDDDEESDADEEETETSRGSGNGVSHGDRQHQSNDSRIGGEDDLEGEDEDDDSGDEIDEEEGDDDDDVVEVHEIEDSDDEEDGVDDDEDEEEDEEEVDNDEGDFAEPVSTGRLPSTEGEIDGHEQGEDEDDEDDNGETGEEDQGVDEGEFEDAEDEEEDYGTGYLVQPVGQAVGGSDVDPGNEDEDAILAEEYDEEDDEGEVQEVPPSSSSHKRKRNGEEVDEDDGSNGGRDSGEEDDDVVLSRSSKQRK